MTQQYGSTHKILILHLAGLEQWILGLRIKHAYHCAIIYIYIHVYVYMYVCIYNLQMPILQKTGCGLTFLPITVARSGKSSCPTSRYK